MKLKSLHIALVIMLTVFGGIGLSAVLGLWETTNDKIPAVYTSGEASGQFNPADIKGSYTFDEIQKSFGVPVSDLAIAFGVNDPENAGAFQCKELETLYADSLADGKEIGTGSVRYFVALYKHLPFEVEEGTYLPVRAVEILKEKTGLSGTVLEELLKITVETPVSSDKAVTPVPSAQETAPPGTIKGTTTFKELLDWGVTQQEIETVIGSPLPDSGRIMKDYATEKGIEFTTWKDALQKIADEKSN